MCFSRSGLKSRDHLVLTDNLDLLAVMEDGCVDLVYIDPPFGTGKRREGPETENGAAGYDDTINEPEEFVEWLAPRMRELWRVLSDNGSIVIHLDPRAVHHVRLWCDREFGVDRWENEIVWHYTGGGRSKARFSRKHDILLWYSKGDGRVFNIDAIREPYKPTSGYAKGGIVSRKGKKYMPHPEGTPADDVWGIPIVNPMSGERSAYPTQKPVKLLERVIAALSSPEAVVCDVFCGSGTTAVVCRTLGRSSICCDNNPDAIRATLERLASVGKAHPPAVLSHGLYRLPFAVPERAKSMAARFIREGLRLNDGVPAEILLPSWIQEESPAQPLRMSDIIIRVEG
jgi:DNA modification methylase